GASSSTGNAAFPTLGINGGEIMPGLRVIPSDAVAAGQVILVDAASLAGNADAIELSVLSEASMMLDSSPDSPPTGSTFFQSLWQQNLSAIVAERFFGAQKLRASSVAALSNPGSYLSGFSP